MKQDKNTLLSRILLIGICFAIFMMCYVRFSKSYDPLARYPYATDENRELILEYLSDEDINYIIDNQIKPELFMDFMTHDDFKMKNTVYYSICKSAQDADIDYIVNFVNRYRPQFTKDSLKELLKHYTYADLVSFYETESVVHDYLKLVADPTTQYVLLDANHSVYKYVPDNLKQVDSIYVKEEVVEDLTSMMNSYNTVMGEKLTFESGYLSYEDCMNLYLQYQELVGDAVDTYYLDAGMNEQQLGYTIVLSGCHDYICPPENNEETEEEKIEREKKENDRLEWIEENAYRYGFVIRYAEGKEDVTEHEANPYILRYVGKDVAKKMHKNKKALEEMGL